MYIDDDTTISWRDDMFQEAAFEWSFSENVIFFHSTILLPLFSYQVDSISKITRRFYNREVGFHLVEQISAIFRLNCGIYDKDMKFGTKEGGTLRSIIGYKDIAHSSSNRVKNMYMYTKHVLFLKYSIFIEIRKMRYFLKAINELNSKINLSIWSKVYR